MRFVFLLCLLATPVSAEERAAFLGLWGTEKQCSRTPIKEGGTVLAEPIEIREGWLRQGQFWCRLRWFPVEAQGNGLSSGAFAQCGEDGVNGYLLGMRLEDDELTLTWDFPRKTGPYRHCPSG